MKPRITIAFFFGAFLGGAIGLFFAPGWEMAGLVIGPIGAITGAIAAACAAHSRYGILVSAFVTIVSAAGTAYISQAHPGWVIIRSAIVVAASGATATACGFLVFWNRGLRPRQSEKK